MNRKERRRTAKLGPKGATAPLQPASRHGHQPLLAQAIRLHQAGRLAEAEALYREVLATAPGEPEALHFLGLIAHQRGEPQKAVELIERAIAGAGGIAAYHSNLGEAYRALGRGEEAIRCYRRALALTPDLWAARFGLGTALLDAKSYRESAAEFAAVLAADLADVEAHLNLGNALVELERVEEAIDHYQRALALKPDYAEAHLNLGLAQKGKGETRAALASLARAVELAPQLAEAHFQLGVMLAALERHDDARRALEAALALRPDMADALFELGDVLRIQHKAEEAIACFERALALEPAALAPLLGIGNARLDQGRFEEARVWFGKAIERDPKAADAHFHIGISLQQQGRFEEAFVWHQKAVGLEPDHAAAHYHLAMNRKHESRDDQLRQIERALDLPKLSADQRIALSFALAKIHDDMGDYDAAFRHYRAGNDLKKASSLYQADATTAYVDRVIATFGAEFFARMDRADSQSELPVFIVGMPRSGTTLVEQILASHPQVHGAGELDYMRQITQLLPERLAPDLIGGQQPFPECAAKIDASLAERIAEEHLQHLRGHSAAALRITDKTPNNFLRLGLIVLLFPKARIIHCQRDPLDTCLSCYFLRFGQGQAFAYDLIDLGRYYRDCARLMEHWRQVLPSPILDVPYEALVTDQEGWSRKLIGFLGLDWDDRCLAFYRNERQVKTASFWQVRQPVYASSVGRWRRYAKHLGPLFAALGIAAPEG